MVLAQREKKRENDRESSVAGKNAPLWEGVLSSSHAKNHAKAKKEESTEFFRVLENNKRSFTLVSSQKHVSCTLQASFLLFHFP